MNINHVALWAHDIELLKDFYCRWFNASATPEYHNPIRGLTSYLLSFPDGGATLEIMNEPEISDIGSCRKLRGFCHIAISLGSQEAVDGFTDRMRYEGVTILGNPRRTGDGFYESVIADPEGNIVELTV